MTLHGYGLSPTSQTMRAIEMTGEILTTPGMFEEMAEANPDAFGHVYHLYGADPVPYTQRAGCVYRIARSVCKHMTLGNNRRAAALDRWVGTYLRAFMVFLAVEDEMQDPEKVREYWQLMMRALQAPDECWPGFIAMHDPRDQMREIIARHEALIAT